MQNNNGIAAFSMTIKKKIRVLECIRQGQIGGGESHLLSLAENLDKTVFDPVVLSFTDGPMVARLQHMKIPVTVIHTEKPFDFFKWKQVKSFIRNNNIELVHAHGTRANSNVLWAAKQLGLPVVYSIHGWSFHNDQNVLVKNVRVLGEKYLTRSSNINISVSESNKQSGMKMLGNFASVVVNNGIDQTKFNPQRPPGNVRAELGIANDEILLLFIARFTSHKQPLALLRAFATAAKQNAKLRLLMVGDGDEKAEALQLVKTLQIEGSVIFQAFRQDVPDVLGAADIFILPSLWEGLPIGLLEAMSMGKAIIATNVDGTCEVVDNEQNGLLVEVPELQVALPAAILRLAADRSLREQFGQKAIETVRDRFNAATMTREIEHIYLQLLQNKNE